jgi:hypothetical protein
VRLVVQRVRSAAVTVASATATTESGGRTPAAAAAASTIAHSRGASARPIGTPAGAVRRVRSARQVA